MTRLRQNARASLVYTRTLGAVVWLLFAAACAGTGDVANGDLATGGVGASASPEAQPLRSAIAGTVTDGDTGAPIPGANVVIVGTTLGTISDLQGSFRIAVPKSGRYDVQASFIGYASTVVTGVRVGKGSENVNVNFSLSPGGIELGELVVEAERPLFRKQAQGNALSRSALQSNRPGAASPFLHRESSSQLGMPGSEEYEFVAENSFVSPLNSPLSTFSTDVDAASYANVRRFINEGVKPPAGAVRIEEFLNYFDYDLDMPNSGHPVGITTELGAAPWNREHRLLRIGMSSKTINRDTVLSNLVFLIDVSGSMQPSDKLPLLKESMTALTDKLTENDRVAIVVYAGAAGLVLESTRGDQREVIREAIGQLGAGGSTAGAAGIRLAYEIARDNFIDGGNNRVILASDGDFNVGISDTSELVRLIEQERESGVYLTVLGFGTGNLKDSRMESLADKGNGNYYYIDGIREGRRVLVDGLMSTIYTVANDVKLQIEFNPRHVSAYRLIGYENRVLAAEDFDDDVKDAGEVGAGHKVTALYEIVPVDPGESASPDLPLDLRYQVRALTMAAGFSDEVATIKVRYKRPGVNSSTRFDHVVSTDDLVRRTSDDQRFAAAVAAFGMLLRGSEYSGSATLDSVMELAVGSLGRDRGGYRSEFLGLVRDYKQLSGVLTAMD